MNPFHNPSDHPHISSTKERVLTMMTALLYLERVSTADLCHGLGFDSTSPDSRWEFALFLAVGVEQMGWVEIDEHDMVSLTDRGVVMARDMERSLIARGFSPRQAMDKALEDEAIDREWASYNGYDPRDPAPEWPEDWAS